MDTFLAQTNYSILYHWLKNQLDKSFDEKRDNWALSLSQTTKQYHISIVFYESGVIEEMIQDIQNDTVLYYIHFQFLNFYQSSKMLNEFLSYFYTLNQNKKRVLVCCSCGMTSSLFAEDFQKFLDENRMHISIEASDIQSLETKNMSYDLILLTPQVNYYKPKLMTKLKKPIVTIPTTDYACHNYINTLSIINDYLEKENPL